MALQIQDYATVAASQTDQVFGGAGSLIDKIVIVPATTAAGTVSFKDGAGSSITIFTGGGTLSDLKPFVVNLGIRAVTAFKITTGANVSLIVSGRVN